MKNNCRTILLDCSTGEILSDEEHIPVRRHKPNKPVCIKTRGDLVKHKTNYPLHVDYEAITLCTMPPLSRQVFTLICEGVKRDNLSDTSVSGMAKKLNISQSNVSRAIASIPPTMLQKEGWLWRVSSLYAHKCPTYYLEHYKRKWLSYLRDNKYFSKTA